MKKIILILIALIMAAGFIGCDIDNNPATDDPSEESEGTTTFEFTSFKELSLDDIEHTGFTYSAPDDDLAMMDTLGMTMESAIGMMGLAMNEVVNNNATISPADERSASMFVKLLVEDEGFSIKSTGSDEGQLMEFYVHHLDVELSSGINTLSSMIMGLLGAEEDSPFDESLLADVVLDGRAGVSLFFEVGSEYWEDAEMKTSLLIDFSVNDLTEELDETTTVDGDLELTMATNILFAPPEDTEDSDPIEYRVPSLLHFEMRSIDGVAISTLEEAINDFLDSSMTGADFTTMCESIWGEIPESEHYFTLTWQFEDSAGEIDDDLSTEYFDFDVLILLLSSLD